MGTLRLTCLAALALCSCGSEDEGCPWPEPGDSFLSVRTELSGNCGPVRSSIEHAGAAIPQGCVADIERHESECFLEATMDCQGGVQHEWWLDGKSGRWVGEDVVETRTCRSTYRYELEPR